MNNVSFESRVPDTEMFFVDTLSKPIRTVYASLFVLLWDILLLLLCNYDVGPSIMVKLLTLESIKLNVR
jgi:hypothetical protein